MKKGIFYITWEFRKLRKTFLWMKSFFFSAQHIFRFTKMADQKTCKKVLSTVPGGFRGREERFYEWTFSFFTPTFKFEVRFSALTVDSCQLTVKSLEFVKNLKFIIIIYVFWVADFKFGVRCSVLTADSLIVDLFSNFLQ